MAKSSKLQKLLERHKQLEQIAERWWDTTEEIRNTILPRRGYFPTRSDMPNEGDNKYDEVLDQTATRALRVLAAGMQGGLTSPARPWFKLEVVDDPDLMDVPAVKLWLEEVTKTMYRLMARSNFYTVVHGSYMDLGGFGTAAFIIEEDEDFTFRCVPLGMGEYMLAVNAAGRVDTLYRRWDMTARQMGQKFGKGKLPPAVARAVTEQPDETFPVIQGIQPRKDGDPDSLRKKDMPFASVYFCEEGEDLLLESGYHEQAIIAPRWDAVGADVYGRGPGHDSLADVRMVNAMRETALLAADKAANPPVNVPSAYKKRLDLLPGGVNYYDGATPDAIRATYQINPNFGPVYQEVERTQYMIREAFFNDLFLMLLERPNMTATEVAERHEEKLLMLGPVIERQFHEELDPSIDRIFSIANRAGKFPEPPEQIVGKELKPKYISMLAAAQQLVGTQGLRAISGYVAELSAVKPEAVDKLNEDAAIDEYAEMLAVPSRVIRTNEEVAAIRQARAEQMRKQQEMEMASQELAQVNQAAQAAKLLGEAKTEPGSVLGEIRGSMGAV